MLTGKELYNILQLRNEVFVVEQNCVYQDCDGKDLKSLHLSGYLNDRLVAYARLLPVGISYSDGASLGRIVTAPSIRGQRVGFALMEAAIRELADYFGKVDIIISAQAHLQKFYNDFGFISEGEIYPEDGIPHIRMRRGSGNPTQ